MLKQQQDASCACCHPAQLLVAAAEPDYMRNSCGHQTCLLLEYLQVHNPVKIMQAAELARLSP